MSHNPLPDDPRVPPPAGDDDRSAREHGRQIAMDALLAALLGPGSAAVPPPIPQPLPLRAAGRGKAAWWLAGVAAAAAVLAGAVLLRVLVGGDGGPAGPDGAADKPITSDRVVISPPDRGRRDDVKPPDDVWTPDAGGLAKLLAAGWRVAPAAGARFTLPAPGRVLLTRGELRITSADGGQRTPLVIETALGTATAEGTDFFIGTHQSDSPAPQGAGGPAAGDVNVNRRITRVLVLAGVVSLANPLGSVSGRAGDLLAAEPDKAPVNHAVKANADFAVDMYKQLAKANAGKNVFFSPYSVSTALAMVAEGARGETAEEIGKTLRFPEAARRMGAEAQQLPWNTGLIHTGMKELGDRFNGKDKPVPPGVRERIAELEKQFLTISNLEGDQARKIRKELGTLRTMVDQHERRVAQLLVANGLWGAKAYPFRPEFLDAMKAHYGAGGVGVGDVDFQGDPEGARKAFNDWASDRTKGRIQEVLPAGSVTPDTRLILANAIYFKGEWEEPFDASDTKPADFLSARGKAKTPMMRRSGLGNARYAAFKADGSLFATPERVPDDPSRRPAVYPGAGGFQMVELPYKGGDLSMVALVPQTVDGLAALENGLTSERLSAWTAALKGRKVHVELPKFRMETDYDLVPTLKTFGMKRAFQVGLADFGGITSSEGLSIGVVCHKAFVEVNEKGTEAAAVTGLPLAEDRPEEMVPFTPTVRADRPFLYVIRDVKTGTILFMGRVTDPTAK